MANIDLVGQCPGEINHRFVVTLMDPSAKKSTPLTPKVGAFGVIGLAKGVPTVSGSFKLAVPKTGLEVDLAALGDRNGGNTITFTVGTKRYAYLGCRWSEEDLSVNNASGDVTISVNFVGTERIEL